MGQTPFWFPREPRFTGQPQASWLCDFEEIVNSLGTVSGEPGGREHARASGRCMLGLKMASTASCPRSPSPPEAEDGCSAAGDPVESHGGEP